MEIFKDIPDYEGRYQASNLGRIKSLKRYVNNPSGGKKIVIGRILKQDRSLIKYFTVSLYKNNKAKHCSIHRLVLLAFVPNPKNKLCCNHKNGIRTDNRLENLEWVTHSENSIHAIKNKLKNFDNIKRGENLTCIEMNGIFKLRNQGISIRLIAEKFNRCYTTIYYLLIGKTHKERAKLAKKRCTHNMSNN